MYEETGGSEGNNLLDISIKAGVGLVILGAGYVAGAVTGKKSAAKEASEKDNQARYKMLKTFESGKKPKVSDFYTVEETEALEKAISGNRTKKVAQTLDN